jgi:hypothetical protein
MHGYTADTAKMRVYRLDERYVFMDMALVEPGYYVGWAVLHEMSRDDAARGARDHVLNSLREFDARDGSDKLRRLKLKRDDLFKRSTQQVEIKATLGGLDIVPYRWVGSAQSSHEPVNDRKSFISLDVESEVFFRHLEEAFDIGREHSQ